jgi:hypothetical protein
LTQRDTNSVNITAPKQSPLVERVAEAMFSANCIAGDYRFTSDMHKEHLLTYAQAAIAACHAVEMKAALQKCMIVLSGQSMSKLSLVNALESAVAVLSKLDGQP